MNEIRIFCCYFLRESAATAIVLMLFTMYYPPFVKKSAIGIWEKAEAMPRKWVGSCIADSTNSHSQDGFEMPHHLHIISAKFSWIFLYNKSITRKSDSVFKLLCSENKKGGERIITNITQNKNKNTHKTKQGKSQPGCFSCNSVKYFWCSEVLRQMQAQNKTQPCQANCFRAASMATIPANKGGRKYVNLNKFTGLFLQKKSFHVVWNSQTARVMFLHINGNPFWYLHYWFLHFL